MKTSKKGLDLIKRFEGWHSAPYLDPIGIPTIGYGFTYYLPSRQKVNTELNQRYAGASEIEISEFKVFSKQELHSKLDGVALSFEERDLLERCLVK